MNINEARNSHISISLGLSKNIESEIYEIIVPDIEQNDLEKQNEHFSEIAKNLLELEEGRDYKFYSWNNKKLINYSGDKLSLHECKFKEMEFPVDFFLFSDGLPSDVYFYSDYVKIGPEYWAFLKVESMPQALCANFLEQFKTDYCLQIHKQSVLASNILLARKQNSADKLASTYHRNSLEEKKYRQAEELKEKIDDNCDSLFKYSVTFVVKNYSGELLEENIEFLSKNLKDHKVKAVREQIGCKQAFEDVFIGVFSRIRSSLETSSYIANMLPFKRDYIHSEGVSLSSVTDEQMFLNVFDPNAVNPHMYISGATGTGKSSFAGYYVFSYIEKFNSNAIFIDLGGGLSRISSYLGGEDFSAKINLNLFGSDIRFIRDFIVAILGEKNISRIDKGKIYSIIETHLKEESKLNFKQLVDLLDEEIPGIKYYFSEYQEYFVSDDSFVLPKICYVDTAKVPDELLPAYLVYIRRLADELSGKTFIVWDECWKFAEKASYAISYAIKTDRKKDISNIFINQEYDKVGFGDSDLTDIIHSNINFKIIFNQGPIKTIKNSTDQLLLSSVITTVKGKHAKALILADGIKKVVKIEFNPFYFELTMTEKIGMEQQRIFLERHCEFLDFRTAFNKWIHFKYEHGRGIYV